MTEFNFNDYRKHLENSTSINDCDRVPVPKCAEHQNYIFISYSHKDYKKVYHDLAAMYEAGVRFWYDEALTAGYDWDAEVFKKINDPHCSGVIFYLSESFFESESIYKEVLTTLGKNSGADTAQPKNYFCVNLTDKMPSALIEGSFVASLECDEILEKTNENLKDVLLDAFRDKATYIPFGAKGYLDRLLVQIRRNFNVIDLTGDDASLIGEYSGEMLNGKRCGYGVCRYEDGKVYMGEWKDNKYHGKGKLIYAEGDSREYLEGVFSEHKANGQCVFKFKNGDCYEGNMTDGKLTGQFVYTQKDGYIYEGDMVAGEKHGKGKITYPANLIEATYEGDWLNNNAHGYGVLTYKSGKTWEGSWERNFRKDGYGAVELSDGETYTGEWKDNKYHGKGKLIYSKGSALDYYDGEWVNGKRSGKGVLIFKNGRSYEGEWLNGDYNGKGKFTYSESASYEYYDGDWVDSERTGYGIMKLKNGNVYEGEFKNDKYHGKGKFTYSESSKVEYFEGDWKNDKKNGYGVMKFKSGDLYEGEWLDDNYHGVGKYYYTEASELAFYEGEWANSKRHGKGLIVFKNGDKWEGIYEKGSEYDGYGTIIKSNDIYTGELKNGKANGKGKWIYKKSEKLDYYEGDFVDDKRVGFGLLMFKNGGFYEGEWLNDDYNGKGKFTYSESSNIEYYDGDWKDDKKTGYGIMKFKNKQMYDGEWLEDKYHGKGKFYYNESSNAKLYDGEWKNDQRCGHGLLTYKDGASWEGEWLNDNEYDGFGTITYSNGRTYHGNLKNGYFHGKGKYTYAPDEAWQYYEGDWLEGKITGYGVMVYAKDTDFIQKYEGEWLDGQQSGVGTGYYLNGIRYEGEWANGKFNGKGTYFRPGFFREKRTTGYWKNGAYDLSKSKMWGWLFRLSEDMPQYSGDKVDGLFQGKGRLVDENGEYNGDFVKGFRNGYGTQRFKDGAFYDGSWEKDCFNGEGKFIDPEKVEFNGTFQMDKLISGVITFTDDSTSEVKDGVVLDKEAFDRISKDSKKFLKIK